MPSETRTTVTLSSEIRAAFAAARAPRSSLRAPSSAPAASAVARAGPLGIGPVHHSAALRDHRQVCGAFGRVTGPWDSSTASWPSSPVWPTAALAWGIAQALAAQGATLAFTYAADASRSACARWPRRWARLFVERCDVQDDAELDAVFRRGEAYPRLDVLVHAVAFARREELAGRYVDTARADFARARRQRLLAGGLARRAAPLMAGQQQHPDASPTAARGARDPNYNVMGVAKAALEASVRYLARDLGPNGIRVNAIAPGRCSTWPRAGIPGSPTWRRSSPSARRSAATSEDDVGAAAVYLLSPASRAASPATTLYVDAGYHAMGM